MSDVLARFHGALVEEILARRPEYLRAPFTVAEIYQNLVPYGTHRDSIGVAMNGDYEDALLRLLAGEGGYLVLDSDSALRVLREELDAANPNTGLYREFAAVDVRLSPARLPASLVGPGLGVPTMEAPVSLDDLAPEPEPDAPYAGITSAAPERALAPAVEAMGTRQPPDDCPWCRAELPKRANLNFCPFCGTDVHVVPCPGCGEELDPEWRFCIACGTEVRG